MAFRKPWPPSLKAVLRREELRLSNQKASLRRLIRQKLRRQIRHLGLSARSFQEQMSTSSLIPAITCIVTSSSPKTQLPISYVHLKPLTRSPSTLTVEISPALPRLPPSELKCCAE